MGILPLQYLQGQSADSLGLTGKETYSIDLPEDIRPGQNLTVKVRVHSRDPQLPAFLYILPYWSCIALTLTGEVQLNY